MSASVSVKLPMMPVASPTSDDCQRWMHSAKAGVRRAVGMTFDRKGINDAFGLYVLVSPSPHPQAIVRTIEPIFEALRRGGAIRNAGLCQRVEIEFSPYIDDIQATVMETKLRIPLAAKQVRRRKSKSSSNQTEIGSDA